MNTATASASDLSTVELMQTLGLQAKQASALVAKASAATKNKALLALARLFRAARPEEIAAGCHGFVEQQRGNQKTGYDEKYIDTDKPPGKTRKTRVIRNHRNDRDGAQAIDVRTVFTFGVLKYFFHPGILFLSATCPGLN